MRKILSLLVAAVMMFVIIAACAPAADTPPPQADAPADAPAEAPAEAPADVGAPPPPEAPVDPDRETINVWSFTPEIPNAILRFTELNPDFPYNINVTVIATDGGGYQTALNSALMAAGAESPDIFTAEAAFVLNHTQGDAVAFSMPYRELGIDVDNLIAQAQIAQYIVDLGTNPDGEVVGLAFQNTGSALIYRRSIAIEVFGTDDPAEIGRITGENGWDSFLEAAQVLHDAGYAISSGEGCLWQVVRNTAAAPYIDEDGYLNLDPAREIYIDLAYTMFHNDFSNKNPAWSEGWFADMGGHGEREVFSFLGPAWLINYVMIHNVGDTFGDWAITTPPVPFSWGGTWVIPAANMNPAVRDGVATLLEWITLDTSETGFQQLFANGNLFEGSTLFPEEAAAFAAGEFAKDAVASGVVMDRSDGTLDLLGGQDMFDIFIPAGAGATGDFFGPFDETINQLFDDQVTQYIEGIKDRDQAIADFKQTVTDLLDIPHR